MLHIHIYVYQHLPVWRISETKLCKKHWNSRVVIIHAVQSLHFDSSRLRAKVNTARHVIIAVANISQWQLTLIVSSIPSSLLWPFPTYRNHACHLSSYSGFRLLWEILCRMDFHENIKKQRFGSRKLCPFLPFRDTKMHGRLAWAEAIIFNNSVKVHAMWDFSMQLKSAVHVLYMYVVQCFFLPPLLYWRVSSLLQWCETFVEFGTHLHRYLHPVVELKQGKSVRISAGYYCTAAGLLN